MSFEIIGALVNVATFLVLLATFLYPIMTRPNFQISYEIDDPVPFGLSEIRIKGQTAPAAKLIPIRLWNSGNKAIKREAFQGPIIIRFPQAHVAGVQVLNTQPPIIQEYAKPKGQLDSIILEPFFLNIMDSITLLALATKYPTEMTPIIDTQIEDLTFKPVIPGIRKTRDKRVYWSRVILTILGVSITTTSSFFISVGPQENALFQLLVSIMMAEGFVVIWDLVGLWPLKFLYPVKSWKNRFIWFMLVPTLLIAAIIFLVLHLIFATTTVPYNSGGSI